MIKIQIKQGGQIIDKRLKKIFSDDEKESKYL